MRTRTIAAAVPIALLAAPLIAYVAPATVGADLGLVVLSGSMEPTFAPGDVVFVETDVAYADIGVGDVITYQSHPGSSVTYTHRVMDVREDLQGRVLQTKGDANDGPDPVLVDEPMVVGRVERVLPWYGHVIIHLSSKAAYLVMTWILVPIISIEVARPSRGREPTRFQLLPQDPSAVATPMTRFQLLRR